MQNNPQITLPATERVMRTLKDRIKAGQIAPAERLPSVRSLAEQLGVSRHIAWVAVKELEKQGLVGRNGRSFVVCEKSREHRFSTITKTVVVLSFDLDTPLETLHPGNIWAINFGIYRSLAQAKYNCLRIDPNFMTADDFIRLIDERPQGVVAFRDTLQHYTSLNVLSELVAAKIPTVVYGYDPELVMYDSVKSDQEDGSYQLTNWLINEGCRKILRYWSFRPHLNPSPHWLIDRDTGYERAMQDAGLEVLPPWRCHDLPFHADTPAEFKMKSDYIAGQLAQAMVQFGRIDAIVTSSDIQTFPVAEAVRLLHKKPNKDIRIVGYDNYWQHTTEMKFANEPPLIATIDKLNQQIGLEMADLLIKRMNESINNGPLHRAVKPQLVQIDTNANINIHFR